MLRTQSTAAMLLAAFCLALSAATARAGQPALESSMEMDFNAIAAIDGIRVVAATDVQVPNYTGDFAPPQVLEIIRQGQVPISLGRLMTSCSCLKATMEKRDFAQGERALIVVRNVRATPPAGATYALFARLSSPYQATLQYEIFVKSGAAPTAAPVTAPAQPQTAASLDYDAIQPYMPKAKAGESGQ